MLAQKETQQHPNDPLAWYDLGDVFMNDKKYGDAIPCLTKATALQPQMGPAWFDLGNSLAYLGKFDDAMPALIKSVSVMPNYPLNWLALTEVYAARKDLAGGETEMQQLLQTHPIAATAGARSATSNPPREKTDLALGHLQKAVALLPNYAHALNSLGLAYGDAQLALGIDCYLRATKADPGDPEAWNNLGFSYYKTGEYPKAVDAYQHALQANPQHPLALYNLVTAYAAQKQWDQARQACDNLARVIPAQAAQLRERFPELNAPLPASAPGAVSTPANPAPGP